MRRRPPTFSSARTRGLKGKAAIVERRAHDDQRGAADPQRELGVVNAQLEHTRATAERARAYATRSSRPSASPCWCSTRTCASFAPIRFSIRRSGSRAPTRKVARCETWATVSGHGVPSRRTQGSAGFRRAPEQPREHVDASVGRSRQIFVLATARSFPPMQPFRRRPQTSVQQPRWPPRREAPQRERRGAGQEITSTAIRFRSPH
jgi:hypothetical protein